MTVSVHQIATQHVPSFIAAPGEPDTLMIVMGVLLGLAVVGFGVLFLRLHTLPERLAHKSQKIQFELVAVLGLIALFTHMHIFWIIGLLLALVDLPDFGRPLNRIAGSVERIAGSTGESNLRETSVPANLAIAKQEAASGMGDGHSARAATRSDQPNLMPVANVERSHA